MARNDAPGREGGITRREALARTAAGAALLAGVGAWAAPRRGAEGRPPNVLYIMTDQQHRDTISALGCPYLHTPGQDRLAELGVAFTNCYSTNPLCSPARSSMVTGRMPSETGVYENGKRVDPSVPNIGQWLSQMTDYECLYTGKWHVPQSRTADIPGFRVPVTGLGGQGNLGDTSVSLACEGYLRDHDPAQPFLLVASFLQPHDICQWLRINQQPVGELRYPEIAADLPPLPANFPPVAEEPQAVIRQRANDEPGSGEWTELHWRYYRWTYYRMIEQLDTEIARLIRALEETDQLEGTLIVLTSDHGEGLAHHQMARKNFLYDESANVPLLIAQPERVRTGAVDARQVVSHLDIVPTICDAIGLEPPPEQRGLSLMQTLEDGAHLGREYVVSEVSAGPLARMVRTERHKYVNYADDLAEQLFDMADDPGETRSIVDDAQGILGDHRRMLAEWEERLIHPPSLPEDRHWPRG